MEDIAAPALPQSRARHRCCCLKTPGIAIHGRADTWAKKVTEILRGADQEKKKEAVPGRQHTSCLFVSQTPHPMPASHDLRGKMSQERLSPAAVVPEGILPSRRASCAGLVGHSSTCKSSTDWSLLYPQNLGSDSSCLCEIPKQEVNAPERSCKAHGRLFSAREEDGAAARS